jgi:aryl-alcohol dehydrogenase-like predicted oxidoreductase
MGWKPVARSPQEATIRAAVEAGIGFFDTADIYGRGGPRTRSARCCPVPRPDAIVETKVGLLPATTEDGSDIRRMYSREHIARSLDASLRRPQVDLYLRHGPPLEVLRGGEAWEALERAVEAGKVSMRAYRSAPGSPRKSMGTSPMADQGTRYL